MKQKTTINTLWEALEKEHTLPSTKVLQHLSGLMGKEAARFAQTWPELPVDIRRQLIQTLGKMAEADFEMDFAIVFRLAIEDPDPDVRRYAIEGLWEDEDVRLIPHLSKLLREDENTRVRAACAQCLAHFVLLGELRKIRPRYFEIACEALRASYRDPKESLEVQRRALESLAYVGQPDISEMITEAYAHHEETMIISAVFAMGRSADKRWASIVLRELDSPDPAMRYEATRASGELELQDAIQPLIELTDDVDAQVQQMALWALGQIGGELARRTLKRYLNADNEALQTAAEEALNTLEFFHGSLNTLFGPPDHFSGAAEIPWDYDDEGDFEDEAEGDDATWLY